ncbi:MAG: hypothetical protein EZS28_038858 [Streblomastix strix]|uniref:Uncharacterized protein n=1 Tax=Streblomastix strix TaxID=222440 RepID=A0A5J4U4B9_9EUKA|nr:MAG: hypothetical protein EZS28_038858 [Streblomastix strix]
MLSLLETLQTDVIYTYCASILAVLGMLPIVIEKAREAKMAGKQYGGSFLIYGEAEIEEDDEETIQQMKDQLLSNYKQQLNDQENQGLQKIENEKHRQRDARRRHIKYIASLNQQIKSQEALNENENGELSEDQLNNQQNELMQRNDQKINEQLRSLSNKVGQTDKLVESKMNEVDYLEEQTIQHKKDIHKLKQIQKLQDINKPRKRVNYKKEEEQDDDDEEEEDDDDNETSYSEREGKSRKKDKY